ncbi:MAG: hypothetical protein QXF88_00260 [Candidatus Aenigmatarchaeota archaeon]
MNINNGSKKMYTVKEGILYNGDGNPNYFSGIKKGTVYFPQDSNGEELISKELILMYFPNIKGVSKKYTRIAAGDGVVFELLPDDAIVILQ